MPLLMAIAGKGPMRGFFLAYVCGFCFFSGVFSWSYEIPGFNVVHHAILAIFMSTYFGIFGLFFSFLTNRLNAVLVCISAPIIWVCLEYVRSNLPLIALPWPLLSHSQYQNLPIIQIASLTGAYGVSFIIVFVNATLAALLHSLIFSKNGLLHFGWSINRRDRLLLTGACGLLTVCVLAYGHWSLAKPLAEGKIKLSVLQGNIDLEKKRHPRKHAAFIMQRYAELSEKAAQDSPELIVWPEAATPGLVLKHVGLYGQLRKLIREQSTHFLIGSSEFPKFQKIKTGERKPGNTALYLSPEGKVLGQYLKIRLLPFGEYIPFEKTFPWPSFIYVDTNKNWEIPGDEATLFDIEGFKFGVIICWENAFPALFRRFVKNGANFMINITNEGWFGESAAPYQFLAMSVFRAVENRISLARAANTGVSCFIDPNGRIVDRVRTRGKDIFVEGYLTRQIVATQEKTFYTRYGDVFVFINMLFVGCLVIVALKKPKNTP